VDLTPVAQFLTTDSREDTDRLGLGAEHDLSALPTGRARLGDLLFAVPPGRAAVLGSRLGDREPASLEVPIGRKAGEVALLNATGWKVPSGTVVGRMVVQYTEGATEEFQLVSGRTTAAWTDAAAASDALIAWRGRTRAGEPISLRLTRWRNPHPESTIRSLRFEPLDPEAAWTLFGVTLVNATDPKGP